MDPVEKKDSSVEDEKDLEKDKKSEEEKKDDFEKEEEFVSAGKYNAAVRKQREMEEELRKLKKDPSKAPTKKEDVDEEDDEDEDEEEDDFLDDEKSKKKSAKKTDSEDPYKKDLEEIKSRLDQREAEDRSKQRKAFFKLHPQYLKDSEKWESLLEELDTSINPHSKLNYYQQLTKAHVLLTGGTTNKKVEADIEKAKADMASEASGKGDGSQKPADNNHSGPDERSLRLAKKMPPGYGFKINE